MTDVPREAEAKGTNFTGLLRALEALRGKAVREQVVRATRGPCGEALRSGDVVPVGWYPASWYVELHRATHEITHGGAPLARELGAHTVSQDFTTIHRMLVRVLGPRTVASHSHRIFQLYWRGGSIALTESREDLVVARFTGWRGFQPVLWEDLAGSVEALLTLVGARSVRSRVGAVSTDHADADIETRFR